MVYLLLTGGSFIPAFLQLCCKHSKQARWTGSKAEAIVEYIFGSVLKKYIDKKGKTAYVLLNYKAPHFYTHLLFIILIQLIAVAGVQFVDTFLLVEYNSCFMSGLTCCYNYSTLFDCSNSRFPENDNNTSITSYRLCLALVHRLDLLSAGVTTSALFIVIVCVLLLKLSNGSSGSKYRARSTIFLQVSAVLVIVAILCIMCGLKIATHYPNFIKIANIAITIFAIAFIMIPWHKFKRLEDTRTMGQYSLAMDDNSSVL